MRKLEQQENKNNRNFADFRRKLKTSPRGGRTPLGEGAHSRWGYRLSNAVRDSFTLQEINDLIRSGDIESLIDLSKFYYRTNGNYRNNINLLATLPKYDTVITPIFDLDKKKDQKKIIASFYKANTFIDDLNVPVTFSHISREFLKCGVYYGILREENGKPTIQDLPARFCRTRFKDYNNLDILEFNVAYFHNIVDDLMREEALRNFPKIVEQVYRKWDKGKAESPWVEIPALMGGVSFSYGDRTPLLIASIPELHKMEEAVEREGRRDENELYKLLIQKMPIDNKGELVFQLDEVADIHASVAEMLGELDTVDVLTTFGDTSLESVQDTTAASQSADRIEKYKTNAYDSLGRSSILFNADGSSALAYSIQKDEALMHSITNIYANWLRFQINQRFATTNCKFDFTILPTTVFNQKEIQGQYFQAAQYGYSKMYAGVAVGIKQINQLSLMAFENDFLKMSEKMIPLQSSYTTSGKDVAEESKNKNKNSEENTVKGNNGRDLNNSGGRPTLDDKEKSEKTQANIKAEG